MEKKKWLDTKAITEIAILSAMAFALDFFQGGIWRGVFTNGGSIGLSMLPILILAYRRGFRCSLIGAFILSFLQMLGGVYAIAASWYMVLLQILLDYILAYPVVALAGLFFKKFKEGDDKQRIIYLSLGTLVGGLAKLLCHYLAGVIFWASSCPEGFLGGPAVFSLVYNGAYMIPNIIISIAVLLVIYKIQKGIYFIDKGGKLNEKAN